MLASVIGSQVETMVSQIVDLLGDLETDEKTALRYAKVLADKSGIQAHSVGETMITDDIRESAKHWRKSAFEFCKNELIRGSALAHNVGRFDLVSRCEGLKNEVHLVMQGTMESATMA